eukprot:13465569-Alexandrium_andersonii.AAC.1
MDCWAKLPQPLAPTSARACQGLQADRVRLRRADCGSEVLRGHVPGAVVQRGQTLGQLPQTERALAAVVAPIARLLHLGGYERIARAR